MARENHQRRRLAASLDALASESAAGLRGGTAAPALRLGTRAGYDRWAEVYDSDGNPLVALEEPVVRRLLGPVSGLRIADIGCGTGRHALRLAEAGAQVTAVDFSSGMLHKARAAPRASAPDFLLHDLTKPFPLPDAAFDRVLCCLVVEHISRLGPFFQELSRICRPGGSVLVTAMHPFLMLLGLSARFTEPQTGRRVLPRSYPQRGSDYVAAALAAGLRLDHMSEHSPGPALARKLPRARKYAGWPMLLALRWLRL